MRDKHLNLIGVKKSRLTVLDIIHYSKKSELKYDINYFVLYCKCDCGNTTTIKPHIFLRKNDFSCGCLRSELVRERVFIDGRKKLKEYRTWSYMKQRCYNPNNNRYHRYGGRGIVVCERWKDNFLNFYNDMGPKPKGLTLDRINNNDNYEPSNCKWATYLQQANNRAQRSCKIKN